MQTSTTLTEQTATCNYSSIRPAGRWRAFSAPPPTEEAAALESRLLMDRYRASHQHTARRPWSPWDRALAAEVEARCWGVPELSRLLDRRFPRWLEPYCVQVSAKGRRMARPLWEKILADLVMVYRSGAIALMLGGAEAAAEYNVSERTWWRAVDELEARQLIRREHSYVEVDDGTRHRDRSVNLYTLGPELLQHRDALLEGVEGLPGNRRRRELAARTLRAAARRARGAREVATRRAGHAHRVRWARRNPSHPAAIGLRLQHEPADVETSNENPPNEPEIVGLDAFGVAAPEAVEAPKDSRAETRQTRPKPSHAATARTPNHRPAPRQAPPAATSELTGATHPPKVPQDPRARRASPPTLNCQSGITTRPGLGAGSASPTQTQPRAQTAAVNRKNEPPPFAPTAPAAADPRGFRSGSPPGALARPSPLGGARCAQIAGDAAAIPRPNTGPAAFAQDPELGELLARLGAVVADKAPACPECAGTGYLWRDGCPPCPSCR